VSAFGPPVAGLRTIRIVLLLVACGVMMNTAGNVVPFVLNADRIDQINEERTRNTEASCERESGQNAAIMSFLRQRHASGDALRDAEKFFPVRKPGECARIARHQVTQNP
jgi:hypothetical protein